RSGSSPRTCPRPTEHCWSLPRGKRASPSRAGTSATTSTSPTACSPNACFTKPQPPQNDGYASGLKRFTCVRNDAGGQAMRKATRFLVLFGAGAALAACKEQSDQNIAVDNIAANADCEA